VSKTLAPNRPWLTGSAIQELKKLIRPGMRVLEYGSGGSTIWFGLKGCKVLSAEHKWQWYATTWQRILKHKLEEVVCLYFRAEEQGKSVYLGADHKYHHRYARAATIASAVLGEEPELVLIDGRARLGCIVCAAAIRPRPIIVLDDAQRERYASSVPLLTEAGYWQKNVTEEGYDTHFWFPSDGR